MDLNVSEILTVLEIMSVNLRNVFQDLTPVIPDPVDLERSVLLDLLEIPSVDASLDLSPTLIPSLDASLNVSEILTVLEEITSVKIKSRSIFNKESTKV